MNQSYFNIFIGCTHYKINTNKAKKTDFEV